MLQHTDTISELYGYSLGFLRFNSRDGVVLMWYRSISNRISFLSSCMHASPTSLLPFLSFPAYPIPLLSCVSTCVCLSVRVASSDCITAVCRYLPSLMYISHSVCVYTWCERVSQDCERVACICYSVGDCGYLFVCRHSILYSDSLCSGSAFVVSVALPVDACVRVYSTLTFSLCVLVYALKHCSSIGCVVRKWLDFSSAATDVSSNHWFEVMEEFTSEVSSTFNTQ